MSTQTHTNPLEKKAGKAAGRNFALVDVRLPATEILNGYRQFKLLFNWAIKILMFPKLIMTFFLRSARKKHLLLLGETLMLNQRHNFCIYCSAVLIYCQITV